MDRTTLHLALVLITTCCVLAADSKPCLTFLPSEIDIGTRRTGERIVVRTVGVNRGPKPVSIKSVRSSCGCIVARSQASSLEPGGDVTIEIEVEGLGIEGRLRKSVWVATEEPDKQVYTITIRGQFESATHQLYSSVRVVDLGSRVQGDVVRRWVGIQRNGHVPVGPLMATPSAEWLQVAGIKGQESKAARIHIVFQIPQRSQTIQEEITLRGREPSDFLRIPVRGSIIPRIRVSPTAVLLDADKTSYDLRVLGDQEEAILVKQTFEGHGLVLEDVEYGTAASGEPHVIVRINTESQKRDLAKGRLLLYFSGQVEPAEVWFVKAPPN